MDELTSGLIVLVILAFLVERGLALWFDWKNCEKFLSEHHLKVPISFAVAWLICAGLGLNLLDDLCAAYTNGCTRTSNVDSPDPMVAWITYAGGVPNWIGYIATASIVAGGSAGAVKLFQDVMGFRKESRDLIRRNQDLKLEAMNREAEAKVATASAEVAVANAKRTAEVARINAESAAAVRDATLGRSGGVGNGKVIGRLRKRRIAIARSLST